MHNRKPAESSPSHEVADQYAKAAREFQALSMLTGHFDAFDAVGDDDTEDAEDYAMAAEK